MTAVAQTTLLVKEDLALRRWAIAAVIVAAVHVALVLWLMRTQDLSATGAPPAVVMIDLPPMEVAPPAQTSPNVPEGPEAAEAKPEETKPPPTVAAPELPLVQKPPAVLVNPATPKPPKPKPKKIIKEAHKPTVMPTREPPAARTTAPKSAQAARGQMSAAPVRGSAGSGASAASWRAQIFAHLLAHKPAGGVETGAVSIAFTLARSGRLLAAHLAGSSGNSALDSKAMEMVRHSNPFPAAPAEVGGASFAFVVPVRFR